MKPIKATLLVNCFKNIDDPIPNIENYYALYLVIKCNYKRSEALKAMGVLEERETRVTNNEKLLHKLKNMETTYILRNFAHLLQREIAEILDVSQYSISGYLRQMPKQQQDGRRRKRL